MKNDITNRGDIEMLVNAFYDKVKTDDKIGLFFTDVIHVNWEQHLPRMYDFWDNVLFQTGSYIGNPMQKCGIVKKSSSQYCCYHASSCKSVK